MFLESKIEGVICLRLDIRLKYQGVVPGTFFLRFYHISDVYYACFISDADTLKVPPKMPLFK